MNGTLRAATFIDKGGTGKTTVTAHLGVACVQHGYEVLLIDLAGKQGDLTQQFGRWQEYEERIEANEAWPNVATVFQDEWAAIAEKLGDGVVEELILRTEECVDLIPAHPGLDTVDAELGEIDEPQERYARFGRFLDEYIDPLRYDIVLIDLPGVSNNVSLNGVSAAGNVIAPVEPESFGVSQLQNLESDLNQMETVLDRDIELTMIILNAVDLRTRLAYEYRDTLVREYPETVPPVAIPKSQDIRNAAKNGHTAFRLSSPSNSAQSARQAFRENAEELIRRLEDSEEVVPA